MHEVLSPLRSAGSVGICAAIGATSMLAALVGTPSSAVAQEWWEQIPGFGSPSYSNRRERVQPAVRRTQEQQADKFEDLRPNATPWLSDVMLASMDKAIEPYERIVHRGG